MSSGLRKRVIAAGAVIGLVVAYVVVEMVLDAATVRSTPHGPSGARSDWGPRSTAAHAPELASAPGEEAILARATFTPSMAVASASASPASIAASSATPQLSEPVRATASDLKPSVMLAQVITTPAGIKVTRRGGCLIVPLRPGVGASPWDDRWCDAIPPIGSEMAGWAPDFLIDAVNFAERQSCGSLGCAIGSRAANLYIVAQGIPNAGVGIDPPKKQLRLMITTGAIDFTEAATVTLYDEVAASLSGIDSARGFSDWLASIDAGGGKPCRLRVQSPLRKLTEDEFVKIRSAAQVFFRWVMAHEFAHVTAGPDCGTGDTDPMTIERACDALAFDRMARSKAMLPPFAVAPLVAMSHYEAVLRVRLGRMMAPALGQSIEELFPARVWNQRASALVGLWKKTCEGGGDTTTVCADGWKKYHGKMTELLARPLPATCTPDADEGASVGPLHGSHPTATFANNPEARDCLAEGETDTQWTKSAENPVVNYSFSIRNECAATVECVLKTVVGDDKDDAFNPYSAVEVTQKVGPQTSAKVTGRLAWNPAREKGTSPLLRFPLSDGAALGSAVCRFDGPPPPKDGSVIRPSEYFTFAGFKYGDSASRIEALLGKPEEVRDYKGKTRYYKYFGGGLRLGVHLKSGQVSIIDVAEGRAMDELHKRGLVDRKLQLVGKKKDEVIVRLGQPSDENSDNYRYEYEVDGRRGNVSFECYDFNEHRCEKVGVHWFY